MRTAVLAAATLAAALTTAPPAGAEVIEAGCRVTLVNAPSGTSDSCTYTAYGTVGTHSLQVFQGFGASEVVCTTGSDYLGQPAPRGWSWEFDRTGECTLTLTVWNETSFGTGSATAHAD